MLGKMEAGEKMRVARVKKIKREIEVEESKEEKVKGVERRLKEAIERSREKISCELEIKKEAKMKRM